jgi:hypothetical protein
MSCYELEPDGYDLYVPCLRHLKIDTDRFWPCWRCHPIEYGIKYSFGLFMVFMFPLVLVLDSLGLLPNK